jgi:dimethylargininase
MITALTRPTGAELAECELTHIEREPIDVALAVEQHATYVQVLSDLGVAVLELERLPTHPDAVFVEDTVLVLDEVAVLLRPGAASRRGEVVSVAEALEPYRPLLTIEAPAVIDGGDLIVLGNRILVGVTTRTDAAGAAALADAVADFGYVVQTVPVSGCLHLKSAATAADPETLVAHLPWVDLSDVDAKVIETADDEPAGANVVALEGLLITDVAAPSTADRLAGAGYDIVAIDVSEFAKAEGALTCKSVLFTT